MKRTLKKLPAVLLAMLMALTLMPVAALADGGEQGTDTLMVLVKNTLVDTSEWNQDLKIDDLFGTEAKASVLSQKEYYAEAVKTEGGYTFSADLFYRNGFAKADPSDWTFALPDNGGNVIEEGATFDPATKTGFISEGTVEAKGDGTADIQLQILMPVDPETNVTAALTVTAPEGCMTGGRTEAELNPFLSAEVQILEEESAGYIISLDQITVRINGNETPLETKDYTYHTVTGVLTIAADGCEVWDISVDIAETQPVSSPDGYMDGTDTPLLADSDEDINSFGVSAYLKGFDFDRYHVGNIIETAQAFFADYNYAGRNPYNGDMWFWNNTVNNSTNPKTTDVYSQDGFGVDLIYIGIPKTIDGQDFTLYAESSCTTSGNYSSVNSGSHPDYNPAFYAWCHHLSVASGQYRTGYDKTVDLAIRLIAKKTEADGSTTAVLSCETCLYEDASSVQTSGCVFKVRSVPQAGTIELTKVSAEPSVTTGNSNYSLAGAAYGIYSDASCSDASLIATMQTGEDGKAGCEIACGSYWIKERTPSEGFSLDRTVYPVTVTGNATVTVTSTEPIAKGTITVNVVSEMPEMTDGNACYSLAGAQVGIYNNEACTASSLVATASSDPYAATPDSVVGGGTTDAQGHAGATDLAYGTYWVKETKASKGFSNRGIVYKVTLTKQVPEATVTIPQPPDNDPFMIQIKKNALDCGYVYTLPLEGTQFTVTYFDNMDGDDTGTPKQAWVVATDEYDRVFMQGTRDGGFYYGTLVSGTLYYSDGDRITWPIGTYHVEETMASDGFTTDGNEFIDMTGTTHLDGYTTVITGAEDEGNLTATNFLTANNYPVQISTVAENAADGSHYMETEGSVTINETITLSYLGDNGSTTTYRLVSTLVDRATGETVQEKEQSWTTSDYSDTSKSTVFEISDASAYKGHTLVVYEDLYSYKPNGEEVIIASEHDPDNEDQSVHFASVTTELTDTADGAHVSGSTGTVSFTDSIYCSSLIAGQEYIIEGTLAYADTGEAADTERTSFTATAETQTVTLLYSADTSAMKGKSLVALEHMYVKEADGTKGKEVAAETSLTNESQTVRFPDVQTSLTDKSTGLRNVLAGTADAVLTDSVFYRNVVPGLTYVMKGTLCNKATGQPIKDRHGNSVVSDPVMFVPSSATGYVSVEFDLSETDLAQGMSLVCCETLIYEPSLKVLVIEEDMTLDDQTVDIPHIDTYLATEAGHKTVNGYDTISLTDTITYTNFHPGEEYTVRGRLMIRNEDGTSEPATDDDGKVLSSAVKFTTSGRDGTVSVRFTFTGTCLVGKTIVAFEDIYQEDSSGTEVLVNAHEDINDADQTVAVLELKTKAYNATDGTKQFDSGDDCFITDEVTYTNLEEGKKYTLVTSAVYRETGKYVESKGKKLSNSTTFTAEAGTATCMAGLSLPAGSGAGEIVIYEQLLDADTGNVICVHEDTEDTEQLVYVADVTTKATNAENGTQNCHLTEAIDINDEVTFTGLVPGKKYRAVASLINASTGKIVTTCGKAIRTTVSFTAEKSTGTFSVTLSVPKQTVKGDVVVFEQIVDEDGNILCSEQDMTCKEQTLNFYKGMFPQTGDSSSMTLWIVIAAAAILAIAAVTVIGIRRRKVKKGE